MFFGLVESRLLLDCKINARFFRQGAPVGYSREVRGPHTVFHFVFTIAQAL